MNSIHSKKIEHLRLLLFELSKFHSAKAEFTRKFEKKINRKLHRNFTNRIISGEITFERSLFHYLESAITIGEMVYKKYRYKNQKSITSTKLPLLLEKNISGFFLQEQIHLINSLYDSGNMAASLSAMKNLDSILNKKKLMTLHPYTYGMYCLTFGKLQMQYGTSFGENGSLKYSMQSRKTFLEIGEYELYIKSLNLEGHVYRQLKDYEDAFNIFQKTQQVIESTFLSSDQKAKLAMNINHQLAITLSSITENNQDDSVFKKARTLFKQSNAYYLHSNNEQFYNFAYIREAELYVKNNAVKEADKILGEFEDYCEVGIMTTPRRAIFFRINAEKYLKVDDSKNALKNFKSAVHIGFHEGYDHELEKLEKLYNDYKLLQINLPANFSVYAPVWI